MASLAQIQEIANRGLQDRLPPDKRAKFDEMVRRGMIKVKETKQTYAPPQGNIAKKIPATLDEKIVYGIPETAAQVATSMVAEPLSGIGGMVTSMTPGLEEGSGAGVTEGIQDRMTYQPRTEGGKSLVPDMVEGAVNAAPEIIKRPIKAITKGFEGLQETINRDYGPAAASALSALPTAILEAIPGGLALRKLRRVGKTVPPAKTVTPATVPLDEEYKAIGDNLASGKSQKIADTVNPDQQILKDAEALGIDLNPSHYSTNRAYIDMEQALKSRPGSQLSTVEGKAIVDLGERADDLIENLGGSTDKSLLDANIKADFDGTMTALNDKSDKLYKLVEDTIPRGTRSQPLKTLEFIEQQLDDLGRDESLLTSAEKSIKRLADGETSPTYAALDRVRRDIGSAIGKGSGPFKDDDIGQLKRMYAVLSEDQQGIAQAFGVGNEYKDASALVKQRKRLEDQAVDLFGREVSGSLVPKLKGAATALTQGDVTKLEKLMESIPANRRTEAAASLLNNLFTQGARKSGALGQGFVNAFQGLNRNKGAKEALFKYLPKEAKERFDMLGRVSTGLYNAKALENTSKSARDVIAALDDGGLLRKLYGIGKKVAGAEGVSTATGIPGIGTAVVIGSVLSKGQTAATKVADELFASPDFKRMITNAVSRKPGGATVEKNPKYDAWLKQQKPSVKKEIAAIGFVPWLTQETPEETKSRQ